MKKEDNITDKVHSESVEKPDEHLIIDIGQQIWVLQDSRLLATPWNKQVKPVVLLIVSCRSGDSIDKSKGNPIYIGIKDHNICLSCVEEKKGQVILKLQTQNIMDLYKSKVTKTHFAFYCKNIGNTFTLESVAYPGWFICTSSKTGSTVKMTKDLGNKYNTEFHFSTLT